MKNTYNKPELDICSIEYTEIVTTSTGCSGDNEEQEGKI